MTEDYQEIHALIRGRVQGVGYRFFAERCAEKHSIRGWVRNLPNNDVEVVAQGTKEQLEQFMSLLWQGPRSALVDDIDLEWRLPSKKYDFFSITY